MAYYIIDTQNGNGYISAMVSDEPYSHLVEISVTQDEGAAYDFGDEASASVVLNLLNNGGSRFIGHRPPKPSGH